MNDILSFLTFRTVMLMFSTTFSIIAVMVMLNIITVDDLAVILKLSPEATEALRLVIGRLREVSGNIMDILSQVINQLFSWAGIHVDLSKIHVDLHQAPNAGGANAPHTPGVPNYYNPGNAGK